MKATKRCQALFSLSGFTLIELMIAVLMSTLIVSAVYTSFRAGLDSWKRGQLKSELCQNARIALEQMSREIKGAFSSPKNSYYKFVGEDNAVGDNNTDSLNFVSTSSGLGQLCEIGYFIDDDPNNPTSGLQRRCDPTPDDEFAEGGTTELLAGFVKGLNFRYFDGEEWKDSWLVNKKEEENSFLEEKKNKSLPEAVEITLTFQNSEVQEKPSVFSTVVTIPTSDISSKAEKEL